MKKKVLIVGKDAYLADGFEIESENFQVDKMKRPLDNLFEKYNDYDYVINFCIQPEHFSRLLPENEMIDTSIAKNIKGKTKFVFLSSRKVYGSNPVLKKYSETDELKPFDFYSKNKVNIEKSLNKILGENLLILRTGNIVGLPPKRNCPTFVSWLQSELISNKKVVVTINKDAKKDYISKRYFQYALKEAIKKDLTGVYNLGAGFALTTEQLMKNLVDVNRLEFAPQETESEQFILDCTKLHRFVQPYAEDELLKDCAEIKEKINKEY